MPLKMSLEPYQQATLIYRPSHS